MDKKRTKKNKYVGHKTKSFESSRTRSMVFGLGKALLGLLGMTALSLALIFMHDALTQSRCFAIKTIGIDGNRRVSEQDILKQAGVGLNDNILSVGLKTLRGRLLSNPWIAAAEVSRDLPDTLNIRVREREPIAIVNLGKKYYLDETGRLFKKVDSADKVSLPEVSGLSASDIDSETPQSSEQFCALLELLQLSRLEGTALPIRDIRRIQIDDALGATIYMKEGKRIIELGLGNYAAKYQVLTDIFAHLTRTEQLESVASVFLADLNRVVIGPSKGNTLLDACY